MPVLPTQETASMSTLSCDSSPAVILPRACSSVALRDCPRDLFAPIWRSDMVQYPTFIITVPGSTLDFCSCVRRRAGI